MAKVSSMKGARQHVLAVYLNDEENDFVNFTAEDRGGSRAGWIRSLIRREMRAEKEGRIAK